MPVICVHHIRIFVLPNAWPYRVRLEKFNRLVTRVMFKFFVVLNTLGRVVRMYSPPYTTYV